MALFTFRLPDIGEGISSAEIVAWHVKVGDRVDEDQPIADMMTDKATVEMESPVAGTVVRLAGEAGDSVPIGAMLVDIKVEGEAGAKEPMPSKAGVGKEAADDAAIASPASVRPDPVEAPSLPAQPDPQARAQGIEGFSPNGDGNARSILASPAVRARARDLGVDLRQVKSSGDRIRHADLDAFLLYGAGQGYRPPRRIGIRPDEQVKVIGLRRRIAENMTASKRHIPHFTYVEEIDVTRLEEMREQLNASRGEKLRLTMLPLLIVAICKILPEFPMLNARFDDKAGIVTRYGSVHMGIATQTDAGLMVPVIHDAQDRNMWQLASDIRRLAEAARAGKAKSGELSGSTLTLTSLGNLGGIATTPVINRPEVAIIGPNRVIERPIFATNPFGGRDIVAAKLMNLSISCDHRVVDGWDAASFVQAVRRLLETPVLLLGD